MFRFGCIRWLGVLPVVIIFVICKKLIVAHFSNDKTDNIQRWTHLTFGKGTDHLTQRCMLFCWVE